MHKYWEVPAVEYIKEDITKYMKEEKLTTPKEAVAKLLELLPSAYEKEVDGYSPAVKAWLALQMLNRSSLAYHKSIELGEFIYDTKMFRAEFNCNRYVLHYLPNCKLEPVLPYGLKSCCDIEDMSNMFNNCKLPEGFTLGDKFDTSNVTDMSNMFNDCKLPEGFTLGDEFDTSKVVDR